MSDVVIKAEGLAKRFRIGERERYLALRDILARSLGAPARLLKRSAAKSQGQENELWALKDVSFEIRQGDVVGILGRNGAGKSTLLKVLARVTKPTRGYADLRGRIGTLLEVGTGFHPELTGRENVYLSGAILGMKKTEIHRNFDEIVAFAEVEKFIDTPVKHYSSGMYMRLAFAVAAHLEPEILIVDEVLAVGDLAFQRKCLAKMKSVSESGRTILFVSHNTAAVLNLCNRAIVLKDGSVLCDEDDAARAISIYAGSADGSQQAWLRGPKHPARGPLAFRSMSVSLLGEQPQHRLQILAEVDSREEHAPAMIAFDLLDAASVPIMQALPSLQPVIPYAANTQRVEVTIELPPLIPGGYRISAWLGPHNTQTYDFVESALTFEVTASPSIGRTMPHGRDHGHIVPHSAVKLLSEDAENLVELCRQ